MERKLRKSPEQSQKELWEKKGWRKKYVKGYSVYDGQFKVDQTDKQYIVAGSILERAMEGRKILTILIKFPPASLKQSEAIDLLPINGTPRKLHEVYELQYRQSPPASVGEAILKTEQLLQQHLPEPL